MATKSIYDYSAQEARDLELLCNLERTLAKEQPKHAEEKKAEPKGQEDLGQG